MPTWSRESPFNSREDETLGFLTNPTAFSLFFLFFRGTHVLRVTFETKLILGNVKISGNVGKVEIMNEKGVIFSDRCRKYERICNFFSQICYSMFLRYNNYWLRIDVLASAKYFISKDKIIPSFFPFFSLLINLIFTCKLIM